MKIRAIILTKSAMKKNGKKGACTTAYDTDRQRIVRFVSDPNGSPLPYSVAERFDLLDIVEFELISACPEGPQTENIFVSVESLNVCGHYEGSTELLLDEISKLYSGVPSFMSDPNYRLRSVTEYSHSLEIVKVSDMLITQQTGTWRSGKVSFLYNGHEYNHFSITDQSYDIRGKNISEWDVGDAFLAVSIPTTPFENDNCYYKFIAAVFPINAVVNVKSGLPDSDETPVIARSFTASYSGYSPNFTIFGIPGNASKVPDFQHSCICVLKNILSRAHIVKPSTFVSDAISDLPHGSSYAKNLDTIIRFEYAVLTLAEYGVISFSDETWNFNTDAAPLLRIAAEDVLLWMKNLYCLAGHDFQAPIVLLTPAADAIKINNYYSDVPQRKAGITIVNADDLDHYRVSSGKPISYNIEPSIPDEKRAALIFLLKNIFGYEDFNQGQLQIIVNMLNRRKTIGILPTGGGKSLCYQFSAILQPGVSFSVCPLTSLSQDQKDNLDELGFTRTNFIISDQSKTEKAQILDAFANGRYQIIWISPERFQSEAFREKLETLHNVCYAIIDEVHCLSEWGHDFRTSYLTLIPTIENYCPEATLVGLTATASQAVLKDLKIEFNIDRYGVKALPSLQRENLTMHVVSTYDKTASLRELLTDYEMVNDSTLGIVFTVFKDKTGDPDARPWNFHLLSDIRRMRPDLKATKYHADVPNKREIQEQFKNDELNILSSTKAFGMGINKDDVRYTVHYNLPWSVEAFYQEAGRAGRGKAQKPADCYILYTPESPDIRRETLKLFARDTTPEEIADIQSKNRRALNDVGNIFFLWGRNNQGVDKDVRDIQQTMDKVHRARKETDEEGRLFCIIQEDRWLKQDRLELALYRLRLLNVVTDWTVDWATGYTSFKCYLSGDNSAENMRNSLFKYIKRYDPSFGNPGAADSAKYLKILNDASLPVEERYYRALLEWSYDHIVYSRRMMIYNIKEFCESYQDPISFRRRIDDFLRISDANVVLDGIVDSPEVWEPWFEVFYETEVIDGSLTKRFLGKEECEALHETLARYLESYRNVTGLNLIYCFSGALSGRYNIDLDHDIMASVVSDLPGKYAENSAEISERLFSFLDEHGDKMEEDALKDIADCIVEQQPQEADRYYMRFKNDYAMKVLLYRATEKLRGIMGRKIK